MTAVMLQKWLRLTFLHWRYPVAEIAARLPRGLELDTFDGDAWVGLVPFSLEDWRPSGLPAVPWISHFPETNLRTYVRSRDGVGGVWFFSLDAARLPAVLGAQAIFHLPYRWSKMEIRGGGSGVEYRSRRLWSRSQAHTDIAIEPGLSLAKDELATFLTERYRLYSVIAGRLTYTAIEHDPWPLRSGRLIRLRQSLTSAEKLSEPSGAPLIHYSDGVEARIALPRPVPS